MSTVLKMIEHGAHNFVEIARARCLVCVGTASSCSRVLWFNTKSDFSGVANWHVRSSHYTPRTCQFAAPTKLLLVPKSGAHTLEHGAHTLEHRAHYVLTKSYRELTEHEHRALTLEHGAHL